MLIKTNFSGQICPLDGLRDNPISDLNFLNKKKVACKKRFLKETKETLLNMDHNEKTSTKCTKTDSHRP